MNVQIRLIDYGLRSRAKPFIIQLFSFHTKVWHPSPRAHVSNFLKVLGIMCYDFSKRNDCFPLNPPKRAKMLHWNECS